MTLREYARLIFEMRAKQREFFNPETRRPSTVGEAKALERRVDDATRQILEGQATLFDAPGR